MREQDSGSIRKSSKRKWTHQLRTIMYARITMEFGPYAGWGHSRHPKDKKSRYEAVLRELATYFSAVTNSTFEWTALGMQIDWACSDPKTVIKATQSQVFILNKAAALEMGFIKDSDLPREILVS